MAPPLSKDIHSNFSYKYKLRPSILLRSAKVNARGDTTLDTAPPKPQSSSIDNISMSNYQKCYVQDYTTSDIGDALLVLLPVQYQLNPFSRWNEMMTFNTKSIKLTFTKL